MTLRYAHLIFALSLSALCACEDTRPSHALPQPVLPDAGVVAYTLSDVAVGDLIFDVWIAGPSDGEAVLLLHGFPQTSYQWRLIVPALVNAGYRVIAPNQRGYSPRARPTDDADYAVIHMANDALAIADALSVRSFHLVAHDWGGGVAWLVARLAPLRVSSLTMLSTPHPDAMKQTLDDPTSCQAQASEYLDVMVRPDTAARLVAGGSTAVLPDKYNDPLPDEALYAQMLGSEEALDAALAWYRANVKNRHFESPQMGAIDVPTLYLFGEHEQFFCRQTADLSARLVHAPYRFEVIEGVGHWIAEQAPQALIDRMLPFIATQRGRVSGANPIGPDPTRPFGDGLSGKACRGAPRFDVPSDLPSCDSVCPNAHCVPSSILGDDADIAQGCPDAPDAKCVPDAIMRSLGRFAFSSCTSWLTRDAAACVPRCMVGPLALLLDRSSCGAAEVCAPCSDPLSGKPTGACDDHCSGL